MPEAPDVEIYAKRLGQCTGDVVEAVHVHGSRVRAGTPNWRW